MSPAVTSRLCQVTHILLKNDPRREVEIFHRKGLSICRCHPRELHILKASKSKPSELQGKIQGEILPWTMGVPKSAQSNLVRFHLTHNKSYKMDVGPTTIF
ncbi:hypothetical protein O6H91_Y248500 [Diphasiastrum complanatum]|nr:hypothetical protein O6H91_Y248500 [Diphasiastrum complanatum]